MQKLYYLTEIPRAPPLDADSILVDALQLERHTGVDFGSTNAKPIIEAADHPSSMAMLIAAMSIQPDTIVVRGVSGTPDLQQISSRLAVEEAERGWDDGSIKMFAVMGDTAASIRALTLNWPNLPRLSGLIFSDQRLLALRTGDFTAQRAGLPEPIRLARSLTIARGQELGLPTYAWIAADGNTTNAIGQAEHHGFTGAIITLPIA
jgi:citrate lyase beta subunit